MLAAERVIGHVGVLLGRLDPVQLAVAVPAQPQVSLSAAESGPRPSKLTIMPLALSVLQTDALYYTRFKGPCSEKSRYYQVKCVHSTLRHQTY